MNSKVLIKIYSWMDKTNHRGSTRYFIEQAIDRNSFTIRAKCMKDFCLTFYETSNEWDTFNKLTKQQREALTIQK